MQAALRHTGRAVVTTSAALALGFLTLMMSAWQTIASFGFLVSIAILGALMAASSSGTARHRVCVCGQRSPCKENFQHGPGRTRPGAEVGPAMHRLTQFSLRRPWLTLAVLLAITVGLGAGMSGIKPGYGYRVLIGESHPAIRDLDSMIEQYAGGNPLLIAWECGPGHPCENVFDEASLRMADALTQELEVMPMVRAVESPTNAALLVPASNGFAVRRFVEDGEIAPDAEALGQRAVKDRLWRNTLISKSGDVGVMLVQITDNRPETDIAIVSGIETVLKPHRDRGFNFHMVGDPPGNVISGRSLSESTSKLTPVLVFLIGIVLLLFMRSWQQAAVTLGSTGLALIWSMGLLGHLAWPQDSLLEVLAPLILVFGVCDAMHLLARYAAGRHARTSNTVSEALIQAARDAGPACLITTLTTAAAFLSFTTSALDTFVRFGVIAAFAVTACLVLSFSLLPIAMKWLPADAPRVERATESWNAVMDAVIRTTSKRASTLLVASAILFGFFGWGWSQLRVDQDWIESLGNENEYVQTVRFMEERVGLSDALELDISIPEGTAFEDPGTLATIKELSQSLLRIPELTQSTSALTLMERMNRLLHDDDPAYERTGDSRAANAELLEILSFDDPETLGRWLSLDRSRARLSFDSVILPHSIRERIIGQVEQIIATQLPSNWTAITSGGLTMSHTWVRDVQATQLRSFPVAFAIVFVLVSVFLRSWKLGLAAMIPTLLPVVVILGLMGWAGLTLDVARTMIAAGDRHRGRRRRPYPRPVQGPKRRRP